MGCDAERDNFFAKFTGISIHAARMGCDRFTDQVEAFGIDISIHAARMGCDEYLIGFYRNFTNFNPRSPNGLRLIITHFSVLKCWISIHAARMGCDYYQQ